MNTAWTTKDVYADASVRVTEMVTGEKTRLGCLERAVFSVCRRVPDLTRSAVHKLRRNYPYRVSGETWINIIKAHEAWLDEQKRYHDAQQQWIEERQLALNAFARETCDQEFYEGQISASHRPAAKQAGKDD